MPELTTAGLVTVGILDGIAAGLRGDPSTTGAAQVPAAGVPVAGLPTNLIMIGGIALVGIVALVLLTR